MAMLAHSCGKDTNKRAQCKIKWFLFSLPSASIFGEAKDTNKRAQCKIKWFLFSLPSASIFGEAKVRISERSAK